MTLIVPTQLRTRVVNIRHSPYDILIDRTTIWGNPYSHKQGTRASFVVSSRDEAIAKYAEWILTQPKLLAQIPTLQGKRLGCHCVPQDCHGFHLARLADKNYETL